MKTHLFLAFSLISAALSAAVNPYNWTSKGEMCLALQADFNHAYNTNLQWVKLENSTIYFHVGDNWLTETQAQGAETTVANFIQNTTFSETNNFMNMVSPSPSRWYWLFQYIQTVREEQELTEGMRDNIARKEFSAFFLSSPAHGSWPKSSSYVTAGQYAQYANAWGYTYASGTPKEQAWVEIPKEDKPDTPDTPVVVPELTPKREFRATWFTTHYAIDWPTTYITNSGSSSQIAAQKKELTDILDALVEGNMNAFCFQARPTADAFYPSPYEAWSKNLTGKRGLNPGYDPLAFAVEEGHKRGLEVHLWVNPYRVTASGWLTDTNDATYKSAHQWFIKYDNGSFSGTIIDPGYPEAQRYVVKVLMHMINNYDVDGIIMDDYFYPYGGTTTEDAASKALYKPAGMSDGDWRRSNVDSTMRMLYDTIQAVKPWVRFGIGAFGIWTTQKKVATSYGITLPTGITGLDDYAVQCCNPIEWVKDGYIDYLAPQLYWATTSTDQSYHKLCQWWSQDVCKHFSDQLPGNQVVDFFVSQAAYRFDLDEIVDQIDDNRRYNQTGGPGSIFYNTHCYMKDNELATPLMHKRVAEKRFIYPALPPAMNWKSVPALSPVTNLRVEGSTLKWDGGNAERFTVYMFPDTTSVENAINNAQYLYKVVWGTTSCTIPSTTSHRFAVCPYDRLGNEYAPTVWPTEAAGIVSSDEQPSQPVRKVITSGGQIFIIRDGHVYDLMGRGRP
ncbi:MAG: family 10 glycosylhydrolase [Paludibacteraceae bacterium]|nr:family 10 glycosylhydrolase [Paludibacteraceae bacterium]